MADSKISALTALSAAPASGDYFVIVDVSDTTMSASGTNKKLAASYLLNAAGTVTGATSQAQTFTNGVISTGNLGVGTTPSAPLHVYSSGAQMRLEDSAGGYLDWNTNNDGSSGILNDIDIVPSGGAGNAVFRFFRNTNTTGTVAFEVTRGNNTSTANIRLGGNTDSWLNGTTGNVGVGTSSPSAKLHVSTTLLVGTSATAPIVYGSSVANGDLILEATSNATKTSAYIIMQPNGGGVGIGTATPGGLIEVTGAAGSVRVGTSGNIVEFTRAATNYIICTQASGTLAFVTNGLSPSIANSAIYIDASRQIGIGGQTPAAMLDVNGSIRSSYDTNTTSYFGRAAVGYNGTNSDWATFAHIDQNSGTNAALMQTSGGITILNCATDQYMALAINASIQYYMDASAFYPFTDDSKNLGQVSNRWDDVYATNGTIQTSDERKKKYIADSDLGLAFIERLRPVRYVWRQHKRRHYGLIAQEVKAAMDDLGIDDFAGYIHDEEADAYGLRYSEFVAPLIKAVQELRAEVNELREQVAG